METGGEGESGTNRERSWLCDDLERWGWGGLKREVIHVQLWLICLVVWQKPTQHCKAVFPQLKVNFFKKNGGTGNQSDRKMEAA